MLNANPDQLTEATPTKPQEPLNLSLAISTPWVGRVDESKCRTSATEK